MGRLLAKHHTIGAKPKDHTSTSQLARGCLKLWWIDRESDTIGKVCQGQSGHILAREVVQSGHGPRFRIRTTLSAYGERQPSYRNEEIGAA